MSHWLPAAGTRWRDHTTLGGAPYQVMRLTERGAQTVQTNLTGGDEYGLTPSKRELVYPLRWAVL